MTVEALVPTAVALHHPTTPVGHRRRNLVVGGIAVAALVIGGYAWREHGKATAPAFRFEVVAASRGPIQAQVTATGTVNPIVTVQVGSQVSGTVETLGADFNSKVTPGQMIAQIDPQLFRAAVQQAKANVGAARADIDKARVQLVDAVRTATRNRGLVNQQLLAQATADSSDTAADVARAQVAQAIAATAQAQAALDTANLNLRHTTIVSPIEGTVITRNVDIGQTVAAAFAAPTLFVIGKDLTKMEVDTSIAEADVGRLAPGMIATFTVDAYPAQMFHGAIRQVRSSPQVIQNVVTYNAVIDVDNPTLELKPGMTANLEVIYADRKDAMRVANAGLRFRAPAEIAGKTPQAAPVGKKLVWVLRDGVTHVVTVATGVSDGTYTEVLDDSLKVGDQVITEANPTRRASGVGRVL